MTFCGNFNQVQGFNARTSFRGNLTPNPLPAEGRGDPLVSNALRLTGSRVQIREFSFRGSLSPRRGRGTGWLVICDSLMRKTLRKVYIHGECRKTFESPEFSAYSRIVSGGRISPASIYWLYSHYGNS